MYGNVEKVGGEIVKTCSYGDDLRLLRRCVVIATTCCYCDDLQSSLMIFNPSGCGNSLVVVVERRLAVIVIDVHPIGLREQSCCCGGATTCSHRY